MTVQPTVTLEPDGVTVQVYVVGPPETALGDPFVTLKSALVNPDTLSLKTAWKFLDPAFPGEGEEEESVTVGGVAS